MNEAERLASTDVPAMPDRHTTKKHPAPTAVNGGQDEWFDRLRPYEVVVPGEWQKLARPGTPFHGRCFEMSYRFALDLSLKLAHYDPARGHIWLVHGQYQAMQRHAWVELAGGVVFDGVAQRFY